MTEQVENQKSTQQIIVIFLVVIAVLLAALVVVIVMQKSKTPTAASTAATTPAASTAQAPAGMGSTGMGAGTTAEVEFDAKTATKVEPGSDPVAHVKAYNEAVIAKKWDDAFAKLPLAKRQGYGDAKTYSDDIGSYEITSYKLGKLVEKGDTATVAAEQVTPQMPVTYTWSFKKVGSQWYCVSRDMGGTVE